MAWLTAGKRRPHGIREELDKLADGRMAKIACGKTALSVLFVKVVKTAMSIH